MAVRSSIAVSSSRIALIAVAILLMLPRVAPAQMPVPILSLGERDWSPGNTCVNAPGACSGETWDVDLGMHEFVLSRVTWSESTDLVEIRLHWPPAWSLLGWESCAGILIAGDPSVQGSVLRFSFDDCTPDEPFLRVWMDCPVPGSFSADPRFLHTCWGYETYESMGLYVDIGDWCGAAHHGHCDLCLYEERAGNFHPGEVDLTLPPGMVWADTLDVWGNTGPVCGGLPECCPEWGAGFTGLSSEPSWLRAALLDYQANQGYLSMHYRLEVLGALLGAGVHSGKVWANGGCCSRSNCIPVTVRILAPADVEEINGMTGVLGPPHPNPTSGAIHFGIRLADAGRARVSIVDAGGRQVAQVLDRDLPAGISLQQWRPSDAFRTRLASGIYFIHLESAAGREARAFVIRR